MEKSYFLGDTISVRVEVENNNPYYITPAEKKNRQSSPTLTEIAPTCDHLMALYP
ncbi:unnamed protein product [Oikopleura dioica]|nr:unnamed protein product [Oikopleura dioica]